MYYLINFEFINVYIKLLIRFIEIIKNNNINIPANGNDKTIHTTFTIVVGEKLTQNEVAKVTKEDHKVDMKNEQSYNNLLLNLVIFIILIFATVVIIMIVRKIKKNFKFPQNFSIPDEELGDTSSKTDPEITSDDKNIFS